MYLVCTQKTYIAIGLKALVKTLCGGHVRCPSVIGKTVITRFSQYEMIQERNAQEFSAVTQSLREDSIFWARSRITGWVIMDAQKGGGIHQNQGLEDFSWMNDRECERAK